MRICACVHACMYDHCYHPTVLLGGTVDITVHEIQADGYLRELYNATGGNWGGTNVDSAFR